MAKATEPISARQAWHLAFINEYSTDIQHNSGKENCVADALSRSSISSVSIAIDYEQLTRDQAQDTEMDMYWTAISALKFEDVTIGDSTHTLLCDVSIGRPRSVVPEKW